MYLQFALATSKRIILFETYQNFANIRRARPGKVFETPRTRDSSGVETAGTVSQFVAALLRALALKAHADTGQIYYATPRAHVTRNATWGYRQLDLKRVYSLNLQVVNRNGISIRKQLFFSNQVGQPVKRRTKTKTFCTGLVSSSNQ